MNVGAHRVIRGKLRRLYAIAATNKDAEKDKAILKNRGYKGILIIPVAGAIMTGINSLRRESRGRIYHVWAIPER